MRIILLAALVFGLGFQTADAQFGNSFSTGANGEIRLAPETPRPGDAVTATIIDAGMNAGGSRITWYVNGAELPEAANQREIELTAGPIGTTMSVQAVLNLTTGGQRILRTDFSPLYLDVVIEPQTRVPEFYLGRALPTKGSTINATALLDDGVLSDETLIYTWKLNGRTLGGGGIRGHNQIAFEVPLGRYSTLILEVYKTDGSLIGTRAVLIPSVSQELYFYEINALYGINQMVLTDGYILVSNSTTLRAEPYYLDIRTFNNPDISTWDIGGTESENQLGNPYEVTLQRVGDSSQSTIGFKVHNTTVVSQHAKGNLRINY